jgi:hypothetical protein
MEMKNAVLRCAYGHTDKKKGTNSKLGFTAEMDGRRNFARKIRGWHRLRVFENRVLRRIFGPKGVEVTGEWRNLHSGELHNL